MAQRIEFAGQPALLVSYVDISEERRRGERLAAVGEFGRKLVLSRSPEEVARSVVEGIQAPVGFAEVYLYMVDEKREELVFLARSLDVSPGRCACPWARRRAGSCAPSVPAKSKPSRLVPLSPPAAAHSWPSP